MEKEHKIDDVVETIDETQNEEEILSVEIEEADIETDKAKIVEEAQIVRTKKRKFPKIKITKKKVITFLLALVIGCGVIFGCAVIFENPIKYSLAVSYIEKADSSTSLYGYKPYHDAIDLLDDIGDYKDALELKEEVQDTCYQLAIKSYNLGYSSNAYAILSGIGSDYYNEDAVKALMYKCVYGVLTG